MIRQNEEINLDKFPYEKIEGNLFLISRLYYLLIYKSKQ